MNLTKPRNTQTFCQVTSYTSTAYRYFYPDWSVKKNIQIYGSYASEEGMGCNFQLDAKCFANLSDRQKTRWADLVKKTSLLVDHKYLNKDVLYFSKVMPTLENVILYLYENLNKEWGHKFALRLWEGRNRWVELDEKGLRYGQSCRISCVHKHWNSELSDQENKDLYGKCSGLHGHEYRIEVCIRGSVEEPAGWMISRDKMTEILNKNIVEKYHGQFLNDFLGNTSGEKIALQFYEILKNLFLTQKLYRVGVQETRKNSFFAGAPPFLIPS